MVAQDVNIAEDIYESTPNDAYLPFVPPKYFIISSVITMSAIFEIFITNNGQQTIAVALVKLRALLKVN